MWPPPPQTALDLQSCHFVRAAGVTVLPHAHGGPRRLLRTRGLLRASRVVTSVGREDMARAGACFSFSVVCGPVSP